CARCKGKGRVGAAGCRACAELGTVRGCQGKGKAACAECEGRGTVECSACRGAKSDGRECRKCGGSGEEEGPGFCVRCGGTGRRGKGKCYLCKGRGKQATTCTECKGMGSAARS